MSYLSVISVEDAKKYLRVEHSDSDIEIKSMIESALSLIEERTCHLMYTRPKTYNYRGSCATINDGPIITDGVTGLATTITRYDFANYTVFEDSNPDNTSVTIDVGYDSAFDIPSPLIQAAYELMDYWYYKSDGTASMRLLSDGAREVLDQYARFVI